VSAGYSGTPLPVKLGIRDGARVATLGAPPGLEALLAPLPAGVRVRAAPRDPGPYDVVVAFARTGRELRQRFSRGRTLMRQDGGLWICWPKRSSPLAGELGEGQVRDHGLSAGLVDNKVCAVDEDWSGLRFVVRREHRTGAGGR
jgi:Protein of unknown function (DUF3052)